MSWTWTNSNNQGEDITPAWGTEVRNAIARIMADLYTSPVNDGTAAGALPAPVETMVPIANGILQCNSGTPVTATVPAGSSLLQDDFVVMTSWQEAFNADDGEIRVVKAVTNGNLTLTFTNSGGTTGKRFGYVVFKRAWE